MGSRGRQERLEHLSAVADPQAIERPILQLANAFAHVVNCADPKDAGTKRLLAAVKRVVAAR